MQPIYLLDGNDQEKLINIDLDNSYHVEKCIDKNRQKQLNIYYRQVKIAEARMESHSMNRTWWYLKIWGVIYNSGQERVLYSSNEYHKGLNKTLQVMVAQIKMFNGYLPNDKIKNLCEYATSMRSIESIESQLMSEVDDFVFYSKGILHNVCVELRAFQDLLKTCDKEGDKTLVLKETYDYIIFLQNLIAFIERLHKGVNDPFIRNRIAMCQPHMINSYHIDVCKLKVIDNNN